MRLVRRSRIGRDLGPILSAISAIVSALLIAVNFDYLRKHGTADDAAWIATGIFVSIVNIFLWLPNLFGDQSDEPARAARARSRG